MAAHDGAVGNPEHFGPVADQLVREARQVCATEALVVALRAAAWVARSRLANTRALRLLDEAARLARRAELPNRLGEVLVSRVAVNLELGRVDAAARDLDRAGSVVDAAAVPDLQLKRATLLHNAGRLREAAVVYRRLVEDGAVAVGVRTRAANNLALVELARARAPQALRHIEQATALAVEVGPWMVASVAHNRGVVLAATGRLADAMGQLATATALFTEAGLPLGESLIDFAETFAELRVLPEAQDLAQRAVRELQAQDVPLMVAEARLRVAEIALLAGDPTTALDAAERAVIQLRRQRRPSWIALATIVAVEAGSRLGPVTREHVLRAGRAADVLARLDSVSDAVQSGLIAGRLARELGRSVIAGRRLRAAYERSRRGPILVRLRGRLAAALAADVDSADRAVLAHCRAGLTDLARHRSALTSMELRALASGHGHELGQLGLGVLLRSGEPSRVLDWTERTRAAALLATEPPAPDAVREERAELAAVQADLAGCRRAGNATPAALLTRQSALEERIRRGTWFRGAAGVGPGRVLGTRELRRSLDGRALVSFGRHGGELFAVVVQAGRTRLHRLGPEEPVRFEADALLFALRRLTRPGSARSLASARASAEHAVDCLAESLVRPLGMDGAVPLVVVPTRVLHRLPWSALHPGPVAVAPSASLWAGTRERPAAAGPGRVLLVAGPGLPGVEGEVDAIATCHRAPVLLGPGEGTVDAVFTALPDADLVHFACHGLLRADNPTFSALQLSDGQLTVHELDLRGIAPRRVVLAACDSAADVGYDGDELLGFVSALLARGTAGLVASVVAVGDVESVGLMRALHEALATGLPMVDALHVARGRVDTADPRAFVNWCAFTAYGAG